MDYLQIANSWPVWLCAGACVVCRFIETAAVCYFKKCFQLRIIHRNTAFLIDFIVA